MVVKNQIFIPLLKRFSDPVSDKREVDVVNQCKAHRCYQKVQVITLFIFGSSNC